MYYVIFGLLGAALLGADQWVKAWVVGHLQLGETTSLFPGFLELLPGKAGPQLRRGVVQLCRAEVAAAGCHRRHFGGGTVGAGSEDRPAPAGDLRLLPDPLRRHWQHHRPTAAGLCGGYAAFPVLAQLSHVQRGGCVHRVRGYSGRNLLRVTLRKA